MPWLKYKLWIFLLLLAPLLLTGQAVDQHRSGVYIATESGATCSQATLSAAGAVAASRGIPVWVPTTDRSKAACTWNITSNLTPGTSLIIPEGARINVASGVTLTLNACPYAGQYQIFNADESTTGAVRFGKPPCEVSPEHWGAAGDGSTSDTLAVEAMLNSGAGLYRFSKAYAITATLDIPSNSTIIGIDRAHTKIIATGMGGMNLLLARDQSHIRIANIALWGHPTDGTTTAGVAAQGNRFDGIHGLTIENTEIANFGQHALNVSRGDGTWISGGNHNSTASVEALLALSSSDVVIRNNIIRDSGSNNIAMFGVRDTVIQGNTLHNSVVGFNILLDDASAATVLDDYAVNTKVVIQGNTGDERIAVSGTAQATITGNTVPTITYRSYDFDQQNNNLPGDPFFHLNYLQRGIQITGNAVNRMILRAGGYLSAHGNILVSTADNESLMLLNDNGILWTNDAITYWDRAVPTTRNPLGIDVSGNTLISRHVDVTGITFGGIQNPLNATALNTVAMTDGGNFAAVVAPTNTTGWAVSWHEVVNASPGPQTYRLRADLHLGGLFSRERLRLEDHYFWMDGNGDLRMSNGEPAGDFSGEVVGAQIGSTAHHHRGAGSPEGVVAAGVGSLYSRTDGGPDSTLYVKTGTGTGNTGWRAVTTALP